MRVFDKALATEAVLEVPSIAAGDMTSSKPDPIPRPIPPHLHPQPPAADNGSNNHDGDGDDGPGDNSNKLHTLSPQPQIPISHEQDTGAMDSPPLFTVEDDDSGDTPKTAPFASHHPPINPPPLLVADLPATHLPHYPPASHHGHNRQPAKRLIIIGDVHGHLGPLQALLSQLNFNHRAGDHAIFAGDLITKGPDSPGVVKLAMGINASAVRGNHEDRVLAAARGLRKLDYWPQQQQTETEDEGLEAKTERQKDRHARQVAKALSKSQLRWIESLPIILRIGSVVDSSSASSEAGAEEPWNAGQITVVHGGLIPGVPFDKQEPWAVMNMRSLVYPARKHRKPHRNSVPIDEDAKVEEGEEDVEEERFDERIAVPVDTREGEPWSKAWNRYQNKLSSPAEKTVVIYGHDAKMDLQTEMDADISPWLGSNKKKPPKKHRKKGVRYAFGLDSGCGAGRRLSALVIEAGAKGVEHRVQSIECGAVAENDGDNADFREAVNE